MKRKALIVITKSNWGGAQRYVYDLATNLPPDEFDVCVAMGGSGRSGDTVGALHTRLLEAGIRTYTISSFMRNISLRQEFSSCIELYKIFRKERPHIVHLNSSKAGGLGALAARLASIPTIIFTSHGLPYEEDRKFWQKAFIYLATWMTFLLCSKVITVSTQNYTRARRLLFCKSKITLIHNGISKPVFLTREQAREALGLPATTPVIGAVGEYTNNKGFRYLIEAAAILKSQGTPFVMLIIGDGEDREHLEELIKTSGVDDCTGLTNSFIPDAYQYFLAFDIFALPSLKEGLPYVLLEAGEAGLPVVASDIGGIRDIIVPEKTGVLVVPKDTEGLAKKLGDLLEHQEARKTVGQALHSHVIEEFSLEKMIRHTAALYRAVSYPPKNSL